MLRSSFPILLLPCLVACSPEAGEPESTAEATPPAEESSEGGVSRSSNYQMVNPTVSMVGTVTPVVARGGLQVPVGDGVARLAVEFDAARGRIDLTVLDGAGEEPIGIGQSEIALRVTAGEETFDLALAAAGSLATGEAAGVNSSHFSKSDERLVGLDAFGAELASVTIGELDFRSIVFELSER